MRYECLVIDVVNLCYKVYHKSKESVELIGNKLVYKEFVKSFIRLIEDLKGKYLEDGGSIYLLFDNYKSRADLQSSFLYAARKEIDEGYKKKRSKEEKEFYNSINLIKYYYLIGPSNYYTGRVEGLEADDLVKPLKAMLGEKKILLVTSDLDWCRYIDKSTSWLPKLGEEPRTVEDVSYELGFKVTETSVMAYKALFGDVSDNIPLTIRKTESNVQEFKNSIPNIEYPEQYIKITREMGRDYKDPFYKELSENERQFIVNCQLVATIPCKKEIFENNLLPGRNTEKLYKSLREILGLDVNKVFKFGGLKRPRI